MQCTLNPNNATILVPPPHSTAVQSSNITCLNCLPENHSTPAGKNQRTKVSSQAIAHAPTSPLSSSCAPPPPACGIYLAYKASVGYSSYGSTAEKQRTKNEHTWPANCAHSIKAFRQKELWWKWTKSDKSNKNWKKTRSEKSYSLIHWPTLYPLQNLLKNKTS